MWRKRAQTNQGGYIHRLDMQDGQPDNATTGWEPALQNSQYFSMTGYHWRIWVTLLVIVSLFAAVACVGEDNIKTTAKPILTPRSLPSPVPAVPTPTPGPIQVPTPRPSPTPAVSADSNNSTVEVAGKLVQAPVPTSTPAPDCGSPADSPSYSRNNVRGDAEVISFDGGRYKRRPCHEHGFDCRLCLAI